MIGPCVCLVSYKRGLTLAFPFFSSSLVLGHVLSPVRFLPRHSLFADCKLYIRTHLLASALSNFWKKQLELFFSFL